MTIFDLIRRAWTDLAAEDSLKPGIYQRRLLAQSPRDIHAALDRPAGTRSIYLTGSRRSMQLWREVATRGFRVTLEPASTSPLVRARIELAASSFSELFDRLCADVIEALVAGTTEEKGAAAAWTKLGQWQRFFEKTGNGILSEEKQIGLYGELWMLRRVLQAGSISEQALSAWKGPEAAPQDFAFSGASVEVKTAATSNLHNASISNLAQLDDTGLPALFLLYIAVDRREHWGETLVDLVEDIGGLCGDALRDILGGKLLSAGYNSAQAAQYSAYGYALRSTTFFAVSPGFPRLVRSEVPAGVTEARYELQLVAASAFQVDEAVCMSAITGSIHEAD
jgi:hypothetical protein